MKKEDNDNVFKNDLGTAILTGAFWQIFNEERPDADEATRQRVKSTHDKTKRDLLSRLQIWIDGEEVRYTRTEGFNPDSLREFASVIEKHWDGDYSRITEMYDALLTPE